jgi:hypothetical protein
MKTKLKTSEIEKRVQKMGDLTIMQYILGLRLIGLDMDSIHDYSRSYFGLKLTKEALRKRISRQEEKTEEKDIYALIYHPEMKEMFVNIIFDET